ncbi:formiminotetrahydrofolate cyclodeaminase [Elusimicrobium simillimum]|uniref:cyclodeaminase/cyclohydrolase family protein n=1 Tax=Elusimicrobium simillimum TaxID=3143438 RepID=UPI003C701DF6
MSQFEWKAGIEQYIDALASGNATPGGGSAAAAAGAFGCALIMMAISTTLKLKATPEDVKPALNNVLGEMNACLGTFKNLVSEDSVAYKKYLDTKKAAKADPSISMAPALKEIAVIPVNCALEVLKTLKLSDNIKSGISPIIMSDLNSGVHMLNACLKCCVENMKINLPYVKDAAIVSLLEQTIDQSVKTLEAA